VLRVFCDEQGQAGNPLGVFLDDPPVPADARQATAAKLGFSETVFFDDLPAGTLQIFTPTRELQFAGHPLLGAAWLLAECPDRPSWLHPPVGKVPFGSHNADAWIRALPAHSPPWDRIQLADSQSVRALTGPPNQLGHVQVWAWEDEHAGQVRARVFAKDYGVEEDPATGSAALVLCAELGRELHIIQGQPESESEIKVRPVEQGQLELSGRVHLDRRVRSFALDP
jgi:predicted PhzF superfamily epimerase YddE/YHI9